MSWSDAERKLREEERRWRLDADERARYEAERLRGQQISQERVWQFLAAMKKAGNPGIRYENPLDWLRGKGYWEYSGSGFARALVRTDGTYICALFNDSPGGRDRGGPDKVVEMLLGILRIYNVPIPED